MSNIPDGYHPRMDWESLGVQRLGQAVNCAVCRRPTTGLYGFERNWPQDPDLWVCVECDAAWYESASSVPAHVDSRELVGIDDLAAWCSCGWCGTVGDCEPDVDGDGSLGCPVCFSVVRCDAEQATS